MLVVVSFLDPASQAPASVAFDIGMFVLGKRTSLLLATDIALPLSGTTTHTG
jgi:hypothetical protein